MRCGIVADATQVWPAARASIQPLTWESPYAVGVALKKKKKHKSVISFSVRSIPAFIPFLE